VNHAEAQELLFDHLEGELPPARRAEVEGHLEACGDCARELFELRESLRLLHALPDPEAPPHLTAAVMARIADGEGRRSFFARVFDFLASPGFAMPVAAGFTAVLVLAAVERGSLELPRTTLGAAVEPTAPSAFDGAVAARVTPAFDLPLPATRAQLPRPRTASTFAALNPLRPNPIDRSVWRARGAGAAFAGHAVGNPPLRQLDTELNQLIANPISFLDSVSRLSERQRQFSLDPLILHAAHRGDALDIAHQLRRSSHPFATPVAERFEQVALSR